jgi:hypothetical protein
MNDRKRLDIPNDMAGVGRTTPGSGDPLLGLYLRLDDPANSNVCTVSRIEVDLGGGYFLCRRFDCFGRPSSRHVITLAMMAVREGAELFEDYLQFSQHTGEVRPDDSATMN